MSQLFSWYNTIKLIEHVDHGLYKEYSLEKYKEGPNVKGRSGKGTGQSVPKPDRF